MHKCNSRVLQCPEHAGVKFLPSFARRPAGRACVDRKETSLDSAAGEGGEREEKERKRGREAARLCNTTLPPAVVGLSSGHLSVHARTCAHSLM